MSIQLETGTVIDRYEIEGVLGQGGMAVVYRVRHRTLGSSHALKILTVHGSAVRDRLIREGRVQASLVDPNIVAVTDVIDVHGSPGLIMQFVDGPTLADWLAEHRPTLEEAEQLFDGILSALEMAHSMGVVHRDLKPANVLLARPGGRLIPRVADFGLAKALHEEGAVNMTRTGAVMGTPAYMAPEQIRDASTTDHRGDIFALGCILYDLVVGQTAFQGEHYLDVFNAIRAGTYVRPGALVPDLPARVDMAIRGALITDRERRIPDCATLRLVLSGKRKWATGDEGVLTVGRTIGPSDGNSATIGPISLYEDGAAASPAVAEPKPKTAALGPASLVEPRRVGPPVALPAGAPARPVWQLALGALALCTAVVGLAYAAWPSASVPAPTGQPDRQPLPAPVTEVAVVLPAVEKADPGAPVGPVAPGQSKGAGTVVPKEPPSVAPEKSSGRAALSGKPVDPKVAVAATDARFTFTGADSVRLVGAEGSFPPGHLPPGAYTIQATFNGVANSAGAITLGPGQTVSLHCDADFMTCEK